MRARNVSGRDCRLQVSAGRRDEGLCLMQASTYGSKHGGRDDEEMKREERKSGYQEASLEAPPELSMRYCVCSPLLWFFSLGFNHR